MSEEVKTQEVRETQEPQIEMISLPAKPLKPRPKEHTALAKTIANRYLSVAVLEKMVNAKKAKQKKKEAEKFKMPTTPEEFYDRAQKYLNGAFCAVPFQEKANYYRRASEMYAGAGDHLDSAELAEKYAAIAEQVMKEGYEKAYAAAVELKSKAVSADDWFAAARAFERIPGYLDSDQLAEQCERRLQKLNSIRLPVIVAVLVLTAALIFGLVQYVKTDSFQFAAAKVAYTLGLDSVASDILKNLEEHEGGERLMAEVRYSNALDQMKNGRYSSAVKLLEACDGYEDSEELLRECCYHAGKESLQTGEDQKAHSYLSKAGGYEDADEYLLKADQRLVQAAKPGDEVPFGGGQFILLDEEEGRYLLLSRKLYGKTQGVTYNENREEVEWKDCTMREVLNSSYLTEHFNQLEQEVICPTTLEEGLSDRVFLLSKAEYQQYESVMGKKDALWWLRDRGEQPDSAMFVSDDGIIMEAGYPVDSPAIQGRPAFWVAFP